MSGETVDFLGRRFERDLAEALRLFTDYARRMPDEGRKRRNAPPPRPHLYIVK